MLAKIIKIMYQLLIIQESVELKFTTKVNRIIAPIINKICLQYSVTTPTIRQIRQITAKIMAMVIMIFIMIGINFLYNDFFITFRIAFL